MLTDALPDGDVQVTYNCCVVRFCVPRRDTKGGHRVPLTIPESPVSKAFER